MSKRDRIVAAARELLHEQGPTGVSVRAVAARAGMGPSTLRYYFPAQAELLRAVQSEIVDAQLSDARIHDRMTAPCERLTECMAQFLPTEAQIAAAQAEASGQRAPSGRTIDPATAALVMGSLSLRAHERVMYWLGVLHAEGVLRPGVPVAHATLLLSAVCGLTLELTSPLAPVTLTQARQILYDLIDRAVLVRTLWQQPAARPAWRAIKDSVS